MVVVLKNQAQCPSIDSNQIPEEIGDRDREIFFQINKTKLSTEQEKKIVEPLKIYPHQKNVLAIHWHPEFVPVELAVQRVHAMFPNLQNELIIPTQHNEILCHKGYCGVEVDCYSQGFNQKVQLLLHFREDRIRQANILKSMIEHTRKYRASQLFDFIETITYPHEERLDQAARKTGADQELVNFVQIYVKKIQGLLEENLEDLSPHMIKNKMLRNFFDALRPDFGDQLINRAQNFLKAVKDIVKENFPLEYFYRTSEIIEEARSHGAGIIVPHPEQFWPILLAEYDVDGYEVWNPQSQRYTDFLISVVDRKNKHRSASEKSILISMGDDTHMGEKVKEEKNQDPKKVFREIGYQPAWEDLSINKKLIKAGVSRSTLMQKYLSRLE